MELMLFEGYEIFEKNFYHTKSYNFRKNRCGELIIEILNNTETIKEFIKQGKIILYTNKNYPENRKPLYFLKYENEYNNEKLKPFYELVLQEFENTINEFINQKEYSKNIFKKIKEQNNPISINVFFQEIITNEEIDKNIIHKTELKRAEIKANLYFLKNFIYQQNNNKLIANKNDEDFKILYKEAEKLSPLYIPSQKIIYVIQNNSEIREIRNFNETKKTDHIKYTTIYNLTTVEELFNLFKLLVLENRLHINICKNCQKAFIPTNRSDEVYCNNSSPQNPNKTCKEYGAKKTYRDELKSNKIKGIHNKISQLYRMRISRSKDLKQKAEYEKDFEIYKTKYQKKKENYNNGKGTLKEDEFYEWIKKQKENAINSKK